LSVTVENQPPGTITEYLRTWNQGEPEALGRLMEHVYAELHKLADCCLRDESWVTIRPTALIHEAYLLLGQNSRPELVNRRHFFWYAGRLMRHIFERALARKRVKRGAGAVRLSLDRALEVPDEALLDLDELLTLDQALCALEELKPRYARIVEMRFFAGLEVREVAQLLSVSPTTVKREWAAAQQWLAHAMTVSAVPA